MRNALGKRRPIRELAPGWPKQLCRLLFQSAVQCLRQHSRVGSRQHAECATQKRERIGLACAASLVTYSRYRHNVSPAGKWGTNECRRNTIGAAKASSILATIAGTALRVLGIVGSAMKKAAAFTAARETGCFATADFVLLTQAQSCVSGRSQRLLRRSNGTHKLLLKRSYPTRHQITSFPLLLLFIRWHREAEM